MSNFSNYHVCNVCDMVKPCGRLDDTWVCGDCWPRSQASPLLNFGRDDSGYDSRHVYSEATEYQENAIRAMEDRYL